MGQYTETGFSRLSTTSNNLHWASVAGLRFAPFTQVHTSYKGRWVPTRYRDLFILVILDPVRHNYWVSRGLMACMEGSAGLGEDLDNRVLRFNHLISH